VKLSIWTAACLLALAGCGGAGPGDGGNGVAAVRPSRVDAGALRAAATDPALVRFYEARGWRPAWNSETSAALVAAIGEAPRHGLDSRMFLAAAARSDDPAAREAALSLAALSYAEALARGRTDPARLFEVYQVARPEVDVAAGLNRAIEGNDVASWLGGLAPQDEEYRALSRTYLAESRAAATARPVQIPTGRDIRPGAADPRLPAIAAALGRPAAPHYGPELVAAVRQIQEDYGLTPTGVIGDATLAAIGEGARGRARALAVNLERRRWLAREAPATRIEVNTAAATLAYWRDGAVMDRRKVVLGQPAHPTPELESPLYRLAANPTWTVPRSIQQREIAPKGAGYMQRNNMEWRDGWIVQRPGPRNSLGLVKFDLRNDQEIYLHDTPAKALFAEDLRQRSHGCVRVDDALGFARMIAEQEGVLDRWQQALATREESFVPLPRPIPVRLAYHSAFLDGGRVRYRLDLYGWDDLVARGLGLAVGPRPAIRALSEDIGP